MAGRRAAAAASLAAVLIMSVWFASCFNGKAEAIRADGGERWPPPLGGRPLPYFPRPPPAAGEAEGAGLEESKRRVPSCPDPLHNRSNNEVLKTRRAKGFVLGESPGEI
ncbi:uncharacterized protein LOC122031943 [Zingiber officinale]|uniref:uncharacterized protein LOC122031943 n=1 Tax=Zingiber officinale TaxID=94328 RepID=UPI001C4D4E0B|nr:uncharacterized protein LOC122031943 [Zingiber officinale]